MAVRRRCAITPAGGAALTAHLRRCPTAEPAPAARRQASWRPWCALGARGRMWKATTSSGLRPGPVRCCAIRSGSCSECARLKPAPPLPVALVSRPRPVSNPSSASHSPPLRHVGFPAIMVAAFSCHSEHGLENKLLRAPSRHRLAPPHFRRRFAALVSKLRNAWSPRETANAGSGMVGAREGGRQAGAAARARAAPLSVVMRRL